MTEAAQRSRLAVLGRPIAHSLSPVIHTAAYRALKLDWSYESFDLGAEELEPFLADRDESWRGFSVTMPLKRRAYELSETRDAFARQTEAVNTLVRSSGGWRGFNTDVPGAMSAMQDLLRGRKPSNVLLLGSGATAASIGLAARHLGCDSLAVSARRAEAVSDLHTLLGGGCEVSFVQLPDAKSPARANAKFVEAAAQADLIVNTLPAETAPPLIPLLKPDSLAPLFDVTYHPRPTPLCEHWKGLGRPHSDGRELLVQQAALQIRLFLNGSTNRALPNEHAVLAEMRSACMGE